MAIYHAEADEESDVDPTPRREFVTRLITTGDKDVHSILLYIQDAVRTMGCGSVVCVGKHAVQLTLPVQSLHFLEDTIEELLKIEDDKTYPSMIFYPPIVRVPFKTESLKQVVEELGLCPPDMRVEWISLEEGGALAVSGPDGDEERLKVFRTVVLRSLRSLVLQLAPEALALEL